MNTPKATREEVKSPAEFVNDFADFLDKKRTLIFKKKKYEGKI